MQARSFAIFMLGAACCAEAMAQTKPGLDTTTFVVMGEGLAAGMANFGLSSVVQNQSFPAFVAAQMNTAFPQPLIEPPGIGDVIGYPSQDVRYPTYPQGAVRVFYQPNPANPPAPPLFVLNLSVPGFTLADSVNVQPSLPVIQSDNMKQTVVNLILGFPQLFFQQPVPLWSQFAYAKAMLPTVAMVELGYYEALNAAVNGDPTLMPDPASFGQTYSSVLVGLRGLQAQVIATTIPNPFDTAYFSSATAAAAITATEPFVITAGYHVGPGDYVTRNGLMAISNQFTNGALAPLPAGSILPAAAATAITNQVNALNAQIVSAAKANGAVLYDLNAFLHKVRLSGAQTGSGTVTANYLGGFYSLDGVYPGPTGNALIANDILTFLDQTYQRNFSLVNVSTIAASDAGVRYLMPKGVRHTAASLKIQTTEGRERQ